MVQDIVRLDDLLAEVVRNLQQLDARHTDDLGQAVVQPDHHVGHLVDLLRHRLAVLVLGLDRQVTYAAGPFRRGLFPAGAAHDGLVTHDCYDYVTCFKLKFSKTN
uniref:(northern house mosquito) hypothetical protein n=1 Tax=Culex pipiens TaxID=7175 RepID=A0A8D8CJU5_CULPI